MKWLIHQLDLVIFTNKSILSANEDSPLTQIYVFISFSGVSDLSNWSITRLRARLNRISLKMYVLWQRNSEKDQKNCLSYHFPLNIAFLSILVIGWRTTVNLEVSAWLPIGREYFVVIAENLMNLDVFSGKNIILFDFHGCLAFLTKGFVLVYIKWMNFFPIKGFC